MARANINDLLAYVTVARERSFTRAAAQLGVSQSALSHSMRTLEERLGVRLLTRTTRGGAPTRAGATPLPHTGPPPPGGVAPTEAGERLLRNVGPRLEEIEAELAAITELREKPAGTIRITATEDATDAILLPKLANLLRKYPNIKVEIVIDYGLTDIVAQRFDAGVRSGEQVAM